MSTEPTNAEPQARILVCDDSQTLREVNAGILEPAYHCLLVASGEEALERAEGFQPDLVVSDLNMDGISGYEVCERLRAAGKFRHVPIVLLTSMTDEESRVRGLESGADDYLYKPVRPRELCARVRSLLRLRRSNLALEQRSRELEQANRSLRELQATLVQAEKMASLGTLVGGVSHEINNPLAFIKSGAEAVPGLLGDVRAAFKQLFSAAAPEVQEPAGPRFDSAIADLVDIQGEIAEGARRIEAIVDNLRRCTAMARGAADTVDLTAAVSDAWRDCVGQASTPPRLEVAMPERWGLRTQRPSLEQVLRHVLRNASQAAGPGGWVRVSLQEGVGEVALTVEDSGPGIPAENLNRVFDPFFTTRPPGGGVGLGLTVTHGLMGAQGGRIEVASPPGQGARFTLHWPTGPRAAAGYNDLRYATSPDRAA